MEDPITDLSFLHQGPDLNPSSSNQGLALGLANFELTTQVLWPPRSARSYVICRAEPQKIAHTAQGHP